MLLIIKSPLELVGDKFTRQELYEAFKKCGKKSKGNVLLSHYERDHKIGRIDINHFYKIGVS